MLRIRRKYEPGLSAQMANGRGEVNKNKGMHKTHTGHGLLKTLDTIGNCQRQVFTVGVSQDKSSHLVYLNISIQQQACENLRYIGRRSCEITMKEKTRFVT